MCSEPCNLKELAVAIKDLAGIGRAEALQWFYDLGRRRGIRVTWDRHEGSSGDISVQRIMLSFDVAVGDSADMFRYECNGVIIDTETWDILAVPPRMFNTHVDVKKVNLFLCSDMYDVIRIRDGTLVTLYNWKHPVYGPIWCISTCRGYDVAALRWSNGTSYAEAICHVFQESNIGCSIVYNKNNDPCGLIVDGLLPTHCYTIGFRHHDFHPIINDPMGVWSIQNVELSTLTVRYDTHVPIARQDYINIVGPNVDLIEDSCKQALENAIKAIHNGSNDTCDFVYGYVLRSRTQEITGNHSDVLYKSELLNCLNKLLYKQPPQDVKQRICHSDWLTYNVVHSLLDSKYDSIIKSLLPVYSAPISARLNEIICTLSNSIYEAIRTGAMKPTTDANIDAFAQSLVSHIGKLLTKKAKLSDVIKQIRRPEYAIIYFKLLSH